MSYLCEKFEIPKKADGSTIWTDSKVLSHWDVIMSSHSFGSIESHYRCYLLQYWSVYYITIVVYCTWSSTGRWVDETAGICSYEVHCRKVVGLYATNPYNWKGMYTAVWCYCSCYIVDAGLVLGGYNFKITVCLCVHAFVFEMMLRLTSKWIIRSFSTWKRRATVKLLNGIISACDVCGGFMFNAQRYMCLNDAYFAPSTICFPYEVKVFDRILLELQYLDREHPHHFTLDLVQLDRIF